MPFEKTVLAAIGVRDEDIFVCDRPVQVDHLLAATPMLSMPEYVSPGITKIWDIVGDAIVARPAARSSHADSSVAAAARSERAGTPPRWRRSP